MIHKTYFGKKGYSIYKNSLSLKEQIYIRDELNVKPFISGNPIQQNAYPIYRESTNKFYIPRYFGINTFGEPQEYKITEGSNIELNFNGDLRDKQIFIVNKFMKNIKDGNHGGLLDLYTGMGKTVMALKIISLLKKKTLIIVHKGFLLEQWIERITQFLPNAKIGKIQGQIIDIVDKDIVIGMLQSLSMKEYPEDLFNEFGLTIIDEVHHISAEIFCRALQNIVTMYNLGLSATMNRKDGLSKVFKMFLGDVIHKETNNNDTNVLIKGICYKSVDEEFSEVEYDYKGIVKFSTMISKLCKFNDRSELIVNIIINELKSNPNQQIMILAHFKILLTYIYKSLEFKNQTNIGYYIGGMKQQDLKISENKQIILATYQMASEGLDIKTLTTLILATPKSDVEQSVGRILRMKHENPLVIDIIDQHDNFKKQWNKRRLFYQKKNYTIWIYDNYKFDSSNYKIIEKNNKDTKISKNSINYKNNSNLNSNLDSILDSNLDSNLDFPKNKCLIKLF